LNRRLFSPEQSIFVFKKAGPSVGGLMQQATPTIGGSIPTDVPEKEQGREPPHSGLFH